jgi:fibronectin-binding autotransporter adhesin
MPRNLSVGLRRSLRYAGRGGLLLGAVAACAVGVDAASTGWLQSSGNYFYDDSANWVGGVINNIFDSSLTLTGPLSVLIAHDYTTTGDLFFNYVQGQSTANIPLDGFAFTRPVMSLGGDLHFTPQPAGAGTLPTLSLGANIIVDLGGGARVVEVGSGALVQSASGGNFQNGTLIKTGAGELSMTGTNFVTATEVRGGKLTSSGINSLGFGPISVTSPATLYFKSGARSNAINLTANTALQGSANLSGPLNLGGGVRTLTLGVAGDSAGDATFEFSGVVSNGSLDIVEAAGRTGTLTLSNANLTTGGTTITGATVTGTHPQAFGSGPITLNAGAALNAVSKTGGINLTGANAIPNPITISADVTVGGSNVNTPDVSEFSGAVSLGSTPRTLTVTGPVKLSGAVTATGGAGLTVTGSADLTLGGVNTLPGGVTINGGKVIFARNEAAGTAALTLTGAGTATFPNSTVAGAGAFPNAIVVNGSGTLSAPASAPATLSGPVTLNGGTLSANYVTLTSAVTLGGSISGFNTTLAGPVTVPSAGGQVSGTYVYVQGSVDGPGQLSVSGNVVYLMGANTHQGGTQLTGGNLFFANKSAFGTGTLTVTSGTLSAYNTPMTGQNAVANAVNATGNYMLAPQVPVEFSGPVNLGGTIGTFNALYNGVPVVTSFTGTVTGGNVLLGDGHIFLSGASTLVGISTIANYVDLGASVVPGVPGPLGSLSFEIALDASAMRPSGWNNVPNNVATLNLQPGVTMGRKLKIVGGTISSSGGETSVTGAITLLAGLTIKPGAGGIMHWSSTMDSTGGGFPGQYPITLSGQGTVDLTGRFAGPVQVNSGKLLYNTTQPTISPPSIDVGPAGELGGSGTLLGQTRINGGTLSPGNGIGTLHTAGLTLQSQSVFKLELDSTLRTADLLSASSQVQLGDALLSAVDLGGSVLPLGLKFSILDNTATAATIGTFLNLADGATFQLGSNLFAIDYDAVLEPDGIANDVTLTVIPEPAGGALLGVGVLLAGLARRRTRRQA